MINFYFAAYLICIALSQAQVIFDGSSTYEVENARHFTIPMHEVVQHQIHFGLSQHNEIIVTSASKGSDFQINDYLTHADGVRILSGGLKEFFASGEREVAIPVVDDSDEKDGGSRLVSFVLLQVLSPRKLTGRRGDILFDLEEGGPPPSLQIGNVMIGPGGTKTTTDSDYVPPPRGGGKCITGRDCYNFNGTCVFGQCNCTVPYIGTYCQLFRPETDGIQQLVNKAHIKAARKNQVNIELEKGQLHPDSFEDDVDEDDSLPEHIRYQQKRHDEQIAKAFESKGNRQKLKISPTESSQAGGATNTDTDTATTAPHAKSRIGSVGAAQRSRGEAGRDSSADTDTATTTTDTVTAEHDHSQDHAAEDDSSQAAAKGPGGKRRKLKPGAKRKPKPKPMSDSDDSDGAQVAEHAAHSTAPLSQQATSQSQAAALDDHHFENARDEQQRQQQLKQQQQQELEQQQSQGGNNRQQQQHNQGVSREELARRKAADDEEIAKEKAQRELEEAKRQAENPNASQEEPKQSTMKLDDMYGDNKMYPEPYLAGKVPREFVHIRHRMRTSQKNFVYSVRFRSGPLGISFDNKNADCTRIERVIAGQQAQLSDVQVGDYLIAVDTFNTTLAPAKITQRIITNLPWPKILVFETRSEGVDVVQEAKMLKTRTFNISIIYPPSLVTEFEARLAEWTPRVSMAGDESCPIYKLRSPADQFGCKAMPNEYRLTANDNTSIAAGGVGITEDLQRESPMVALLLQEAAKRAISISFKTMTLMKRGVCTFVEKGMALAAGGADIGVLVNQADELMDMPAGKEVTTQCTAPMAIAREGEAALIHMGAMKGEVLAIISDPMEGLTASCLRTQTMADDIIDKWPNSVPHVPLTKVIKGQSSEKDKLRGLTDEGGRIAVSGENGWAFFDYHLAMFGPQEVPLGPIRLQMAFPPFGCDPNTYTVRIQDTMVAILRGGGCSFGIKVINAQKLGAKAVMIVNTDDMKTMRLMALPDEIPLIKIPCIMVSRRIQYYMEEQLQQYYLINQHMISIQPTGVFGNYEARNSLTLPQRLPGH